MKKWIITTLLAPVIGGLGLYLFNLMGNIKAMAEDRDKYEDAYVQQVQFVQEQRTANELNKQDQDRQWEVIKEQKEYLKTIVERMIDGR